jgi:carbon monoxide dehydrogenase subunit G
VEVKLDKRYELEVSAKQAWRILSDLEAVASCMPGASLGERLGDNSYKGSVKIKVGPATARFGGEVSVLAMDESARTITLKGKGADKGGSTASMELEAIIEDVDDGAVLTGLATVIVNGKFAQFGGRMMVQVSDIILKQFVDNFIVKAKAAETNEGLADLVEVPLSAQANAVPKELNGLGILLALLKSWVGSLFGKKSAS